MEKYAHLEKKSELLWIVVKGWGCGWNYVGELVFNLLVLVGAVKASDRIVKEMMGL